MSTSNKSQRKVCVPKTKANHGRNPNRKASPAANAVQRAGRCSEAYGRDGMPVEIRPKQDNQPDDNPEGLHGPQGQAG